MSSIPVNDDEPSWLLPSFDLIDPAAWQDTPAPDREWALHEWIPARQATYLTGPGSAGKSLLAQQLATCTALGLPFLGIATRPTPAIYITCEDDVDELHRRQLAICASLGIEPRALAGKLHLVSLSGAISSELAVFDAMGHMGTTEAWQRLRGTIMQTEARFIALDNVAHLFAGNENIRNQVAAFCGLLNSLAAEADAAVLFLGHPNKAGDNFSGSTAWENQVRSRLFLDRVEGDDGSSPDPDLRQLSRAKANYARNGETVQFRWHKWAFVNEADLPPHIFDEISDIAKANAENECFLKCLAKATEERRATSPIPAASNYAPRMFARMPTGKGITEKGFQAALERLLHLGVIRNGEPVYKRENRTWATGLQVAQTPAQTPHKPSAQECTNPPPVIRKSCTEAHMPVSVYTKVYKAEPSHGHGAPLQPEPSDEPDWSSGTLSDDDLDYSDSMERDE